MGMEASYHKPLFCYPNFNTVNLTMECSITLRAVIIPKWFTPSNESLIHYLTLVFDILWLKDYI